VTSDIIANNGLNLLKVYEELESSCVKDCSIWQCRCFIALCIYDKQELKAEQALIVLFASAAMFLIN